MADTPVRWHDRVLVARRPAVPGPPVTGIAVGRWMTPSNEPVITVVLDAPQDSGTAILDVFEAQLLVLPGHRTESPLGGRLGPA